MNRFTRNVVLMGLFIGIASCSLYGALGQNRIETPSQSPVIESDNTTNFLSPFVLRSALSLAESKKINNFVGLETIPGRVVHNVWTDFSNTTKPAYLLLNEIGSNLSIEPKAFPVSKNRPLNTDDPDEIEEVLGRSIFDPQFSPDGRYILFKFGQITSPGTYQLYVFDTQTRKTKLVTPAYLQYYATSWSPDSVYVAYAEGEGDPASYDFGRTASGKLNLRICNWRTGEVQDVFASESLRGPWTWKDSQSLLYSSLTPQDELFRINPLYEKGVDTKEGKQVFWERLRGAEKRVPITPNIYEYSTKTHQSKLLSSDGHLPVMSPDGKYIAFFGSADPMRPFVLGDGWQSRPSGTHLIVLSVADIAANDTGATKRIVLSQHYGSYPFLIWSSNSESLFVLQESKKGAVSRLAFRKWNIPTRKFSVLTSLVAKDADEYRSLNDPVFQPIAINHTRRHLMVLVDEYLLLGDNKGAINQDSLQNVDLDTGTITTVGRIRAASGVDWHYIESSLHIQPMTK